MTMRTVARLLWIGFWISTVLSGLVPLLVCLFPGAMHDMVMFLAQSFWL